MGDRTNVIYEVGGALRAADLDKLATVVEKEGAWPIDETESDSPPSEWIAGAIAENEPLSFELFEVNYATNDEVERFLKDIGAHWSKRWSPGGGYGAGREEHDPALDKPIELDCDHDGNAVLKLDTIVVLIADPLIDPGNWLARWASLPARQIPPLSLAE